MLSTTFFTLIPLVIGFPNVIDNLYDCQPRLCMTTDFCSDGILLCLFKVKCPISNKLSELNCLVFLTPMGLCNLNHSRPRLTTTIRPGHNGLADLT